ncbi:SdpI family protein [Clostridium sp. Marseille-Q2269]|uniref:SdpI family protein n=1 Tax=Clostridium sp. Marseille-Q2269 TaxID=2942205 RepID=UPI002073808E|nr:SdpI family protein [Clostridium sp. Marseille-Q2269]
MEIWIAMIIMCLLIPVIMLGFGKYFVKNPPGKINDLFGYRTYMSMRNKDTWEFAHKYCGKLWVIIGKVMLGVSILAMLSVIRKDKNFILVFGGIVSAIQTIVLIGSIIPTEKALKRTFDIHGNRKK